ncbi:hypothetical protein ZIOFF_065925 [Zingiber officinale]|uniref:Uncharacterized protein n=1 Tax=Zingiber officinale TaxID=94328 RepID=A0A8J5EXQ0_ZINOF|nr:hypothetical protein ZIOFF_065925 [Zingiber officinale]
MLETDPENAKRFAPPPSRNRSLNRRKSGDRYDKPNYSQASEGERNHASYPRNFTAVERGEIPISNIANENTRSKLIPLERCSSSEAVQFLAERWAAAVHLLDDPSTDVLGNQKSQLCTREPADHPGSTLSFPNRHEIKWTFLENYNARSRELILVRDLSPGILFSKNLI